MSFTGISSLDQGIDKVSAWLAEITDAFRAEDRRVAYRATRSLHCARTNYVT